MNGSDFVGELRELVGPLALTVERRGKRIAFLKRRQLGIGGSDMPVILGLSTYKPQGRSNPLNALDIYYSKTRPVREEDIEDETIHQLRGHSFEEMALAHYIAKTERDCIRCEGPTHHPDYPNVVVSRDFQIEPDEEREEGKRGRGTGETKAPVSKVFGKVIEDGLRQSELIQLQTNIAVAQDEWGSFCYFNMEHERGPVIAVDQLANPEMGKFLLETGQRFWDECVEPRIPPVPSEWKLLEDKDAPVIIDMSGELEVLEDDDVFRRHVERLLDRKDLKKQAEDDLKAAKEIVFQYLLEKKIGKGQIPALARLTVVTKKGTVTHDWDSLMNALPLDRDAVERWLREYEVEIPAEDGGIPARGSIPIEEIGQMLFECALDFKLFETVGNRSQYLLANRMKK